LQIQKIWSKLPSTTKKFVGDLKNQNGKKSKNNC
jgi:hypothetical protein